MSPNQNEPGLPGLKGIDFPDGKTVVFLLEDGSRFSMDYAFDPSPAYAQGAVVLSFARLGSVIARQQREIEELKAALDLLAKNQAVLAARLSLHTHAEGGQ